MTSCAHDEVLIVQRASTCADGRHLTALLLPPGCNASMTLISERSTVAPAEIDHQRPWSPPPSPSVLPTIVIGDGSVVALRKRTVLALGSLEERRTIDSSRLVSALDLAGRPWWIPARAVWSDADGDRQPQHPRPIGLAAGRSREIALLAGLSDRLGWEANLLGERAASSPSWTASATRAPTARSSTTAVSTTVSPPWSRRRLGRPLGRRSHAVGGATTGPCTGTTGRRPRRRAGGPAGLLAAQHLDVVAVDLGTPLINSAGVERYRCSSRPVSRPGTVVGRRPGQLNPVAAVVTDRSNRPLQV